MAEVEKRHRDRTREERDCRKRDGERSKQRSRSPHQRHEGHHRDKDRDGYHDDRSRGGVRDRHRHQNPHEPRHRREHEPHDMERDRGHHSSETRDRRRDGGRGQNDHGSSREERLRDQEPVRNDRYRHGWTGRPREGQRGREHETRAEERQRHPKRREEEDVSGYEFGGNKEKSKDDEGEEASEAASVEPNYGLSGKLTAETNTFRGVVIKYNEPEEARVPRIRWRLYPFKGDESLPTLYIHRQSAYLIGRERKICDMPVDHPSCSKQHAVIQYRLVDYTKLDGSQGRRVRPYVIDLESTNGTYVNNQRIEPARYYELKEKDMLKFGFSSREYIILHENSKGDEDDDPTSDGEGESGAVKDGGAIGDGSGQNNSDLSSEEEKKSKKTKKKSHKGKKK